MPTPEVTKTIQELHDLVEANMTQQGASDKITGVEIRNVEHSTIDELRRRGVINGGSVANLPNYTRGESGNVLIPGNGLYIPYESAGVPDYVNYFPSGEVGWMWKKVIGITPAFLSLTPIVRQPVTIGSGCENIIIGSNIKTPGIIGNNCKDITIESIDGVWSIGNNCNNIYIKKANNFVMGDGCTDIHIQHLENCSMEGGLKDADFIGKMSDIHLTQAIHTYVYTEPGRGHKTIMWGRSGTVPRVTYDGGSSGGLITYDIDED